MRLAVLTAVLPTVQERADDAVIHQRRETSSRREAISRATGDGRT